MEDATVKLRDGVTRDSLAERETRTDAEGKYGFTGVPAGLYQLGIQLPQEYGAPEIQWQNIDVPGNGGNVMVPPVSAQPIHWRIYAPHVVR